MLFWLFLGLGFEVHIFPQNILSMNFAIIDVHKNSSGSDVGSPFLLLCFVVVVMFVFACVVVVVCEWQHPMAVQGCRLYEGLNVVFCVSAPAHLTPLHSIRPNKFRRTCIYSCLRRHKSPKRQRPSWKLLQTSSIFSTGCCGTIPGC